MIKWKDLWIVRQIDGSNEWLKQWMNYYLRVRPKSIKKANQEQINEWACELAEMQGRTKCINSFIRNGEC